MVDTKDVLAQMRAANPAPSLEHLAVDDLDLVRDIVARGRSAVTTPVREQPHTRLDRLARLGRMRPVLVAGLAFILAFGTLGALLLFRGSDSELAGPEPTIAAGFTCPPGSTPDQPGPADQPRPDGLEYDSKTTFDPGRGRALAFAYRSFWMFDVCTNTWIAAPRPGVIGFYAWTATPQPGEIGAVTDLVYDFDSDRAIAFAQDREVAQVWAYEPDGQRWTRKNNLTVDPLFQAVYDPVTGLVVVRAIPTSQMWTYDVDTDTWTEVHQGTTLPPAGGMLTYDASVDRLILCVKHEDEPTDTWEFDIRAGRWEKQSTNPPNLVFGWGGLNVERFIYDEANQVSVIYGGGQHPTVATYDASEHSWTELWTIHFGTIPGFAELVSDPIQLPGDAMTYDPVNERILVAGGGPEPGVFAFDVATREWITLLEPTLE